MVTKQQHFAGKLTLVMDLGTFLVENDTATVEALPREEAALYECLLLRGSDISAYLVDGDFSFSELERLAVSQDTATDGSPITSALDAAVQVHPITLASVQCSYYATRAYRT